MQEIQVTEPTIELVAVTRVALGIGLGLLVADQFTGEQRRAVGWTLFVVNALITLPLAAAVFRGAQAMQPPSAT